MRRMLLAGGLLLALIAGPAAQALATDPTSTVEGAASDKGDRSITYIRVLRDRPDLAGLSVEGSWFAHFDANEEAPTAGTRAGARDDLPAWVGAFNHTEHPADPGCTEPDDVARGCLPTYAFRTFSQDGPARSAGGFDHWATLGLPDGTCGLAGAIVDPHTFTREQDLPDPTSMVSPPEGDEKPNNNNTINRIQLQDGVPQRFHVGVVVDTTAGEHDPGRLEIRGNVGALDQREEVADTQIETDPRPTDDDLTANGIPDVHVFEVEDFASGDYLKLRLQGIDAPASFSGLLFAERLVPPIPDHAGEGKPRWAGQGPPPAVSTPCA